MTEPDKTTPFLREHEAPDFHCPECGNLIEHPGWGCSVCTKRATMDLGHYKARVSVNEECIGLYITRSLSEGSPGGESVHPGMTPEIARELGKRLIMAADALEGGDANNGETI